MRRWRLREKRVQRGKPTGGGGEGNADFFSIVFTLCISERKQIFRVDESKRACERFVSPLPILQEVFLFGHTLASIPINT